MRGKWTAGHTFVAGQLAVFDDSRVVAEVGSAIGRDDDRTREDARLIAAAPALADAAEPLANYIAGWADLHDTELVSVRVDALRNLAAALSLAHPHKGEEL